MKKKYSVIAALVAISILTMYGFKTYLETNKNKKLNILIISACSLRKDFVSPYAKDDQATPNINSFATRSFVFNNAYTDISWSNVIGFLLKLDKIFFNENKYNAIGSPWTLNIVDKLGIDKETPNYLFISPQTISDTRKIYYTDRNELKEQALNRKNWPFLLEFHTKFLHFPYVRLSRQNQENFSKFVSKNDVEYVLSRIEKFQKNPEKYPQWIFLNILLGDTKEITPAILSQLPIQLQPSFIAALKEKTHPQYAGLLNNKQLLDLWRKSESYQADLSVIKLFYKEKLSQFDDYLKPILEGFGDQDFLDNTLIVLASDHGESFGEHGYVIHGETVYDEALQLPMIIKFPGQQKAVQIDKQIFQGTTLDIVRAVMKGELNLDNFESFIHKFDQDDYIVGRNCMANTISVRYKNQWKLVVDLITNEKMLFNLQVDPKETKNVISENLQIAAELEEHWILSAENPRNQRLDKDCLEPS